MNRTLDSNQLSGTIPTQLGNIKDLIYLYVNIYYSSLWFSKKKKKKKKKEFSIPTNFMEPSQLNWEI